MLIRFADLTRQITNLLGALSQIVATDWIIATKRDDFASAAAGDDPPIVPAPYAFAVWFPIYASCLAYAVYQARPAGASDPLLRRIGWPTALAFLGTDGWLGAAADPKRVWWTVALLTLITLCLSIAMGSRGTMRLVIARPGCSSWQPLSIFFGWCGVATFANATAVLRQTHVTAPGPVESWISAAMLVVATAIAVKATRVLQGNRWYAGTILWALVAIAVADLLGWRRPPNVAVATVALAGVGTVGATVRAMPPDPTSKQARTLVNHQS